MGSDEERQTHEFENAAPILDATDSKEYSITTDTSLTRSKLAQSPVEVQSPVGAQSANAQFTIETRQETHYYGYPAGDLLSQNIREMILAIREDPPATQHFALIEKTLERIARVSVEYNLVEFGKRLYPPRSLALGLSKLTAATGIEVSQKLVDKLLKTLSDDQLIRLAEYLESLYVECDGIGYLVTPITAALDADFRSVIDKIRHQPPAAAHIPDCTDAMLALIHTVSNHWIVAYAEYIPISRRGMKRVNSGTRIINSGLNTLLRKNIGHLSEQQLLILADFFDSTMLRIGKTSREE